jgi:GTPase Era involved in 16S rRNA processing
MAKRFSRATLRRGRAGWCLHYYHPVACDANGKAKRVHRGLGTTNESEAQELVAQVNALIEDPGMHNPSSRERAAIKYKSTAVAAFFVPMQPESYDPWGIRDDEIQLPGGKDANDGYARVQFVGTTGAGKTTVVRQLLGTDPIKERFPLTSTAKATTADMEIVLCAGDFQAVVVFVPRDQVRQYIAECLQAAVVSVLEDAPDRDVIRRFQEHNDQRFRLKYILGDLLSLRAASQDRPDEDDETDEITDASASLMSQDQKGELRSTLEGYLSGIRQLAEASKTQRMVYAKELGLEVNTASREDQEVLQEFVEDWLSDSEEFHEMVDAILEDVESRFKNLEHGDIEWGKDNWPIKWTVKFKSDKRTEFLSIVNRFSSNYAANFGRLLTPLVEGVRVAGPFLPNWHKDGQPKLVLLDGQGIGHTADSSSSLSTSITRRFRLADAIVLVDNAAQPMQAAPCAVLQSIVESGHESKLIVAFTHFDEVKGDNLAGRKARRDHVLSSFENAVHAVRKVFGREAEVALRRMNPERIFFLAGIDARLDLTASGDIKFSVTELRRLVIGIAGMIPAAIPTAPITYTPFYDSANLARAVQTATQSFQSHEASVIRTEHWTRVRALTKYLGLFPDKDGYDTLMPVASLRAQLLKALYKFLSEPVAWQPSGPEADSKERALVIARIRQEIETRLFDLARKRIKEERRKEWIAASSLRGRGSGLARKGDVIAQYGIAVPMPSNDDVWAVVLRDASNSASKMPLPSDEVQFLLEVCGLIAEAIHAGGGILRGWKIGANERRPASD